MDENKIAWRELVKDKICSRTDFESDLQNIHTPYDICHQIISKLKEYSDNIFDKTFQCLNIEFVEVLIYDFNIPKQNIWFFTDCIGKSKICLNYTRYKGVNVIVGNYLSMKGRDDMKFDVIVQNPPYNGSKNFVKGPNQSIWPDFVKNSFHELKSNGFLCTIHPSSWRKPEHELWPLLSSKQIHYLSCYKIGELFKNAVVRVDYYILQNKKRDSTTLINDQNEKEYNINLGNLPFLPSGMIEDISKIISSNKDEIFNIVFDWSVYDPRKSWMNETKTKKCKYPCIHSITSEGLRIVYTSQIKGHFGIKKVIINCGGIIYPYNDYKGEYGMTQNSFGLTISSKKEGDEIVKSMNTEKFKEIVKCIKWGTSGMIDWRFFKYLKKDFWKNF